MTQPPSSMVGDLLREAEAAPHGSTSQEYFLRQAEIAATMLVAHQLAVIAGRLDRMTRPPTPDFFNDTATPAGSIVSIVNTETDEHFGRRVLQSLQRSRRMR